MLLFIDRLPFYRRFPLLPMLLTEPRRDAPPPDAKARLWKFDTGASLEALAWRFHLERCSLDPTLPARLAPRAVNVSYANGSRETLPIRRSSLWLVSNIPHLRNQPLRVPLTQGVPFSNRASPAPDLEKPRLEQVPFPLLGVKACHRARLVIQVDLDELTVSVWAPGSALHNVGRFLRRLPGGFARLNLEEVCEDAWC